MIVPYVQHFRQLLLSMPTIFSLENANLNKLLAESMLDVSMLKDLLANCRRPARGALLCPG